MDRLTSRRSWMFAVLGLSCYPQGPVEIGSAIDLPVVRVVSRFLIDSTGQGARQPTFVVPDAMAG